MNKSSLLWISASPSLKWLHTDLISELAQGRSLYFWEYYQGDDEASSVEQAISLLYDYFQQHDHPPMHLIGHGMSGVVGLLFAQRYPEWVRSLTLLSVGAQPLATWHAHYYVKRNLFEGSQIQTLMYMSHQLFGSSTPYSLRQLADFLQEDLWRSPCPHSVYKTHSLPAQGVSVPFFACGGEFDSITDSSAIHAWYKWLKPADALWFCPQARHFFHYEQPRMTGKAIHQFLARVEQRPTVSVPELSSSFAVVSDDVSQ